MSDALLVQANALHIPLVDQSVHCVVTSPPYYGLRNYNCAGQLGLEKRHDCGGAFTGDECGRCYICAMRQVFREVWRILRDDGTLWLNMGDSYAGSWGAQSRPYAVEGLSATQIEQHPKTTHTGSLTRTPGLKNKDLMGMPWRLAFGLQADGWTLRSDIIWHKPSCMPESVTDRPTKSHEYLFLFSKREQYYYDAEAIKEPAHDWGPRDRTQAKHNTEGLLSAGQPPHHGLDNGNYAATGRNCRDVWSLASEPYHGVHFARFPTAMAERCLLAGTSAHGVCGARCADGRVCGAPYRRVVERQRLLDGTVPVSGTFSRPEEPFRIPANGIGHDRYSTVTTEHGWEPTCTCPPDTPLARPVVFDPFVGSGTTLLAARSHGRHGVGLDLSLEYLKECSRERLGLQALHEWQNGRATHHECFDDLPLFAT